MSEENMEQDQSSYDLTDRIMSVPSLNTRKARLLCKILARLLCKILGHKRGGWSIEVKEGLVKNITYFCERCGHKEVIEMSGDTDRLDVAVAFAMGRPDVALERLVEDDEIK
jgi:hypothetical protein